MKKIIVLVIAILLVGGCGKKMNDKPNSLDTIIAGGEYIIVDVRTEEEFKTGHIVGAINIPHDQINEEVVLDQNKTILIYCRSGARSKIAYENFTKLGYRAYDMGAFAEIDLPKE